jgi:choline dehydrogenase-like flavoprotein
MARRLPKKDVVIIGLGWTGSIMANELTDEGLEVMAIERGPWRDAPTDFPPSQMQDELRYRVRHELFLRPGLANFHVPQQGRSDRAADQELGGLHAAERSRRRWRALER